MTGDRQGDAPRRTISAQAGELRDDPAPADPAVRVRRHHGHRGRPDDGVRPHAPNLPRLLVVDRGAMAGHRRPGAATPARGGARRGAAVQPAAAAGADPDPRRRATLLSAPRGARAAAGGRAAVRLCLSRLARRVVGRRRHGGAPVGLRRRILRAASLQRGADLAPARLRAEHCAARPRHGAAGRCAGAARARAAAADRCGPLAGGRAT